VYREVDFADVSAATAVTDDVAARYPVRYLVNNAGANRPALLEQATASDLNYSFALNVRTPMVLIKGFAQGMRKAGFGRIVSMSSRAVLGKTQRTVYSAAKAAIIGMTRTLSLELASDGITVNVIAPGPVATELFDNGHPKGSEKRQRVIDSIPVKRVGTPGDIVRAVTFPAGRRKRLHYRQTLFMWGGSSVSGSGGA
jgi:3-oxoacyl-[acyl-carrier protein] reductase